MFDCSAGKVIRKLIMKISFLASLCGFMHFIKVYAKLILRCLRFCLSFDLTTA